jgi:hypothetical protein
MLAYSPSMNGMVLKPPFFLFLCSPSLSPPFPPTAVDAMAVLQAGSSLLATLAK